MEMFWRGRPGAQGRGAGWILALALVFALALASCQPPAGAGGTAGTEAASGSGSGETAFSEEGLAVHFLDVGQADCTLLVCDGEAMVIDAGNNEDANTIKNYLYGLGIEEVKYAVGTHPHEDHIGSMDAVVGIWPPETLFLPQVETDTKTFRDVLHAAEEKDVPITRPVIGQTYQLGGGRFTILGPLTDYGDNLNDWSIVLKFTYGDCDFLFTGDAEADAEADLCGSGQDLSADVYQVGHHGSSSSTSPEFLDRVDPEYAVISCGVDNDYGHPHWETLEALEEAEVEIFRTDEQGTVVAYCDGETIQWGTAPVVSLEPDYVLNTRSRKFHRPDCAGAEDIAPGNYQEFQGDRQELLQDGYSPCGSCNP